MSNQLFTRKLSSRGSTQVRATLFGERVAIEKVWFSPFGKVDATRRKAGQEADTMRRLAVLRDETGRAISNNDFIFDCQVEESGDHTTLRMDTVAGWTITEYRTRWHDGVRPWPDGFPTGTMPPFPYLVRVLEIITETAYALQCIHRSAPSHLHCDIKPSNIWVLAGQHPVQRMAGIRLIDFGSAFAPEFLDLEKSPQELLDTYGHVGGTPGFWSPHMKEVYRALLGLQDALDGHLPAAKVESRARICRQALKDLSPADDVFSLVATLFWALTGETPDGKDETTLRKMLDHSLPDLSYGVHRAVEDFILRQLAGCVVSPTQDCDENCIRGLETLLEIVQRTGLHPESLRLCAEQWWQAWNGGQSNYINAADELRLSKSLPGPDAATLSWKSPGHRQAHTLETLLTAQKPKSFCLVGPVGIGKTRLLRYTFEQLLAKPFIVPLYLPLDQVDPTTPDAILRFLNDNYLIFLNDVPDGPGALLRLFAVEQTYRFVLFLDGLEPSRFQKPGPLYAQIRKLSSFARVRVITAGRTPPPLDLPVLYAAPRLGHSPIPGEEFKKGYWFRRLARFRLCQSLLPYPQFQLYHSLTLDSQEDITSAQMNALWLYHQLQPICEEVGGPPAQKTFLQGFLATCAQLFRRGMDHFSPENDRFPTLQANGVTADDLELWLRIGLAARQGDEYFLDSSTRDFGTALFFANEDRFDLLVQCLRETPANSRNLLLFLAELSPGHPMPEAPGSPLLPDEARAFLAGFLPRHSILQKLRELIPAVFYNHSEASNIFFAWLYERGGSLSGCDLSDLPPQIPMLNYARLIGPGFPCHLPRGLPLENIAVLSLPDPLCWMDRREGYLLLAGEKQLVVFDPQSRMIRVTMPEDCREILYAALCPGRERIEVFYSPRNARTYSCYLAFGLSDGAPIPEPLAAFPLERMETLCACHIGKKEWLTSDRKYKLSFRKILDRTYILSTSPFFPEEQEILWEVLPAGKPLPAPPLEYGDLRLDNSADRITLYDIARGELLWHCPQKDFWELVHQGTKLPLYSFRTGVFALLGDGLLFESQSLSGLPLSSEQQYWIMYCDLHGKPRLLSRYNMSQLGATGSERWPKDISIEEKKAFEQQEISETAALNHRVYANGKLYLRSDLKPYLVIVWDMHAKKIERLVLGAYQIESLVREGDRVIAVFAGHKKGVLLSDTAENARHIVPLSSLLHQYNRYIPARRELEPLVLSPLTRQQVEAFLPPVQPGDPMQADVFLHRPADIETISL